MMSVYNKDESFSKLQHVQGEMEYFKVSAENALQDNDEESFAGEEAYFVIHLLNSYDPFVYDKNWKNYDYAKSVILRTMVSEEVLIDVWFDRELNTRFFLTPGWFKYIRQLTINGEIVISYDDVLEDREEEEWNGISQGISSTSLGAFLTLIIYVRRSYLKE
jgi:hypothetical protein